MYNHLRLFVIEIEIHVNKTKKKKILVQLQYIYKYIKNQTPFEEFVKGVNAAGLFFITKEFNLSG